MGEIEMGAVTSLKFSGGRRLLGLVDVAFAIMLLWEDLDEVINNINSASLPTASSFLSASVSAKGRSDLTGSIFVQRLSASERQTTTVTTIASVTVCPPGSLCFSASCEGCHLWTGDGLECQKQRNTHGDCICSCFEGSNMDKVTPGPSKAMTNEATHSAACTPILIAVVAALVTSPTAAARRLA